MVKKALRNRKKSAVVPQTIVVRFKENVNLPYIDSLEKHFTELRLSNLAEIFQGFPGMTMSRLYTTLSYDKIANLMKQAQETDESYKPVNLLLYYRITIPNNVIAEEIIDKLRKIHFIDEVYLEGGPTPPPIVNASDDPRSRNQGYLGPAPAGINARYAWTFNGGDGVGVNFVDMEQGWTLNHEDLVAKGITLISGMNQAYFGHGTSVLGEVVAVDNTIGDVGISPNVSSARVVSQYRTSTNYNNADTIVSAAGVLSFGDVLLLEAQTTVASVSGFLPVEVETAVFDSIRLATALGIVVVEAGGNGSNDLDTFTDTNGQQILDRGSSNFKDSGAIVVGAASSTSPHSRLSFSNYGSRVDCYAWGQNIDSTGDGWTGNQTNTYTSTFGGTSGASPIIAGAALCIQGIAKSLSQLPHIFSPFQMRSFLSDTVTGTASADPTKDKIGVMPNLQAIIDSDLGLHPDAYIRDNPMDQGDPVTTGAISMSPDIIVKSAAVADPTASFGEGSGVEDSITLGDEVESGQDNFVYIRIKNRGGTDMTNASVKVYWSQVASLITPDMWNLIGTINVPLIPTGNTLVVAGPLTWQSANIPAPGHYCFVGIVDHFLDPAPSQPNLVNFTNFETYIRNNNNVTWRNFNVVNNIPPTSPPPFEELKGFVPFPFLLVGAHADDNMAEEHLMDIEIIRKLPNEARLFLEGPIYLPAILKVPKQSVRYNKKKERSLIPLALPKNTLFKEINLGVRTKHPCKLWVRLAETQRKYRYMLAIRQIYKHIEVGRATWMLHTPY